MRFSVYAAAFAALAAFAAPAALGEPHGEPKNQPPFVQPREGVDSTSHVVTPPAEPAPAAEPIPAPSNPVPSIVTPPPPAISSTHRVDAGINFECNYAGQPAHDHVVPQLAGLKWVRMQVWHTLTSDADLGSLDQCVTDLAALGVRTLLIVNWASWAKGPRVDPAELAAAAGRVAAHFKGRIAAYEILNEQDSTNTVTITPGEYAAALRVVYPAIKAADPEALVVTGGTIGANARWLADVYAAGGHGWFDAVAVHPYPYDLAAPPPSGLDTIPAVYAVMAANGDAAKPVWITEYGYSAPAKVTVQQQADDIAGGVRWVAANLPYVPVLIVFQAWAAPVDPVWDGTSLIGDDWTARPALAALTHWG